MADGGAEWALAWSLTGALGGHSFSGCGVWMVLLWPALSPGCPHAAPQCCLQPLQCPPRSALCPWAFSATLRAQSPRLGCQPTGPQYPLATLPVTRQA